MSSGEHAPLARDIYAALAALPSGPIDLTAIHHMTLEELASEAKGARDAAALAHTAADLVGTAALRAAIYAGAILMQIKARLDHGDWLPWIEEHWGKSERSAQVYMKLAREHGLARAALLLGELDAEPNPQSSADLPEPKRLSIHKALGMLQAAREDAAGEAPPAPNPDPDPSPPPAPRSRGPRPPKEGQALKGDKASCSEAIELIEAVESKVQDWYADHLDPDTFDPDELGKSIADLRKALGTAGMKARNIGRSLGLTQLGSPTTVR